jgi:hypothetical protein
MAWLTFVVAGLFDALAKRAGGGRSAFAPLKPPLQRVSKEAVWRVWRTLSGLHSADFEEGRNQAFTVV